MTEYTICAAQGVRNQFTGQARIALEEAQAGDVIILDEKEVEPVIRQLLDALGKRDVMIRVDGDEQGSKPEPGA